MSTSITTHTITSLNGLTLNTITAINNHFANLVGAKQTKRFGTKPAAIKKCLLNQEEFNTKFPAPKVEATTAPKVKFTAKEVTMLKAFTPAPKEKASRFDLTATLSINNSTAKKESIEGLIVSSINGGLVIVSEVIIIIVNNFKRPRSEKNVDEAFAIRKIKRLVKKGKLTLTK